MPPPSRSRAFLHFLPYAFLRFLPSVLLLWLLSVCFVLSCRSARADPPPPGSPTQRKNGQYGTPDLPNASPNFIDWNRMSYLSSEQGHSVALARMAVQNLIQHIKDVELIASNNKEKHDRGIAALEALRDSNNTFLTVSAAEPYQAVYLGSEIRTGNSRTAFTVPIVTYTSALAGYDVGADFLANSKSQDNDSSFGLSLRAELTEQGRGLTRELRRNATSIGGSPRTHDEDQALRTKIAGYVTKLIEKTEPPRISAIALDDPDLVGLEASVRSLRRISDLLATGTASAHALGDDVVRLSRRPAMAAFAGTRLVTGSGSITSEGFSVSKLYPFRDGLPGVTLLYVGEGVEASLSPGYRRSAFQNGAAVIFQDRTPAKNDVYPNNSTALLRPPWSVKVGAEYLAPALGLTKTYTGFVRYRNPHTYAEITLAVGEDGTGKDYGSVAIGRSYLF